MSTCSAIRSPNCTAAYAQLIYVILCAKRDNFSCTDKEVGVQKQLGVLATLLKVLDPKLHQHIGTAIFSSAASLD